MKDSTLFEIQTNLYNDSNLGMCHCGKRINTPNHVYGPDIRHHYLFLLVNSGEAILYTDAKKEIRLKPHDMLVMCPGEKLCYKASTPWSIQSMGLYGNAVEEYTKRLGISGKNPVFHVSRYRELETILEKIYSLAEDNSPAAGLLKISLIYNFFSVLFECSGYKGNIDHISSAIKIIDYNFSNDITVEKLAQTLSLNPSYFTRKFTARTGISPKQYILNKRLEYAKQLLVTTDATILEISNSAGFSDQFYFSRIFKKTQRVSPSEYRKKHCPD